MKLPANLVHTQGFIPSSQTFVLYPSEGSQYVWTANLTAGTSVSFSVVDALGRVGGTSDMRVVQSTDSESCLASNPTSTPGSAPTSNSPNPTETTSNNSPHRGFGCGRLRIGGNHIRCGFLPS